jgi:hypothetical protein
VDYYRRGIPTQLRVEFRGATVTSDAGLLLPRELDERLGLDALIERHLTDPRLVRLKTSGKNVAKARLHREALHADARRHDVREVYGVLERRHSPGDSQGG